MNAASACTSAPCGFVGSSWRKRLATRSAVARARCMSWKVCSVVLLMFFVARRSTSMRVLYVSAFDHLVGQEPGHLREPFVVVEARAVAAGVGELEVADRRGECARERRRPGDVLRTHDVRRRRGEQLVLVAGRQARHASHRADREGAAEVFGMQSLSRHMYWHRPQKPSAMRAVK